MQAADIERRRLEEALAEAKATAVQATQARDHFVANMNHEIRTALAAILGYTEMMYDARQSVTERLQCLGRIRQNAKSLNELVDDLLDFSRLQEGSLEIRLEDVRPHDAFDETLAMLQSQAWKKRIKLEYSVEGTMPATIRTDSRRLRQILLSLVGNAVKFTDRGSVQVSVRLAGNPAKLEVQVRDTGCGIPEDRRGRLFQPFLPGELSMTRSHGGVGLGLALAQRLARALGGDIVLAESESGRGSCFVLTLDPGPVEMPATAPPTPAVLLPEDPPSPRLAESSHALEHMRVLLVEDSRDIQTLVAHFLRRSGARVDVAENGYEAIKRVKSSHFDVVLMDLQMPVLNGIEATEQIRYLGVGTPVVALTAHATPLVKERCLAAGCSDYLTKPLHASTLLQMVRRFRPAV